MSRKGTRRKPSSGPLSSRRNANSDLFEIDLSDIKRSPAHPAIELPHGVAYKYYRLLIHDTRKPGSTIQLAGIHLFAGQDDIARKASSVGVTGTVEDSEDDEERQAAVKVLIDGRTKTIYQHARTLTPRATVAIVLGFKRAVLVDGLAITTARDKPERDPVAFSLEGRNAEDEPWERLAQCRSVATAIPYARGAMSNRFPIAGHYVEKALTRAKRGDFTHYCLYVAATRGGDEEDESGGVQIARLVLYDDEGEVLNDRAIDLTAPMGGSASEAHQALHYLIDADINNCWSSVAPAPTCVVVTFAEPQSVRAYVLTTGPDRPSRDPLAFELWGFNAGDARWTVLDRRGEEKHFSAAMERLPPLAGQTRDRRSGSVPHAWRPVHPFNRANSSVSHTGAGASGASTTKSAGRTSSATTAAASSTRSRQGLRHQVSSSRHHQSGGGSMKRHSSSSVSGSTSFGSSTGSISASKEASASELGSSALFSSS